MPTEKIGLYVGKFQPFHNGHLFAIKHIMPQVGKLVIVIGSSQYSQLAGQPFSARQRRQMIEKAMAAEGFKNYVIIEVPDIHDPDNWVQHLQAYVPRFDVVFTNNTSVEHLFSKKGFKVQSIPALPGVSGTLIRQKLASQEPGWTALVPSATANVLRNSVESRSVFASDQG